MTIYIVFFWSRKNFSRPIIYGVYPNNAEAIKALSRCGDEQYEATIQSKAISNPEEFRELCFLRNENEELKNEIERMKDAIHR